MQDAVIVSATRTAVGKAPAGTLRTVFGGARNSRGESLYGDFPFDTGVASPAWRGMLAMAPTLAYDNALLGEDRSVPVSIAARIESPTLVMDGGASPDWARNAARSLTTVLPNASYRTLEGQTHGVTDEAIAPVLEEFFG